MQEKRMTVLVLELCCFEWFQNATQRLNNHEEVLELCCFEWFQNVVTVVTVCFCVLELCCFEWFQNRQIFL